MSRPARDHGGGLVAAAAAHGGAPGDWLDLSTGINPAPYPVPNLPARAWTRLPDRDLDRACTGAARRFWQVPEAAGVLAVPGLSSAIARMPGLTEAAQVHIPGPTYNEHAAAFAAAGRQVIASRDGGGDAGARVVVHPNNPDGRLARAEELRAGRGGLTVIDESFCDCCPEQSLVALAAEPGVLVLKSFGKFWGLAGARLGFAIGDPVLLERLSELLGPWPVSGPALGLGARALEDFDWAAATRARLVRDAARLDGLMGGAGAGLLGGTSLFRLYDVGDAAAWQDRLARARIWSRVFPYAPGWLRLGLPDAGGWARLEAALG